MGGSLRLGAPSPMKGQVGVKNRRLKDELRRMSDDELDRWIAGWKHGTDKYVAGQRRFEKRPSAMWSKRRESPKTPFHGSRTAETLE